MMSQAFDGRYSGQSRYDIRKSIISRLSIYETKQILGNLDKVVFFDALADAGEFNRLWPELRIKSIFEITTMRRNAVGD